MKLNLGCGWTKLDGFTGVDCKRIIVPDCVDITTDLDSARWPWEDNSIEEIYTAHCMEHLKDPCAAFREIHRILKPGGKCKIIVPHYGSIVAYSRTHLTRFSTLWFHSWLQSDFRGQGDFENDPLLFDATIKWRFFSPTMYFKSKHSLALKIAFKLCSWMVIPIEKIINSNPMFLFAWERVGMFLPDELIFEGIKREIK